MPWIDRDRDGFHDTTGESQEEYAAHQEQLGGPSQDAQRADGRDPYQYGSYGSAEEYDDARRADRDAGRLGGGGSGGAGARGAGPGGGSLTTGTGYGTSETDQALDGTFLVGDLGGSTARQAARRAADEQAQRRADIDYAAQFMPSADDLYVEYGTEDFVGGPGRAEGGQVYADREMAGAQSDALRAMQDVYQQGGITAADRARMQQARAQAGQVARSSRDADMQQLQARGMGGGGATIASMLGAQQQGANVYAQQDAQMQVEAQRRALQAMQSAGSLASQGRGQSYAEGQGRASAIDDFNRWQTDYARGREGRNTDRENQTRESRAGSRQQAYENREREAALRTNQYSQSRDPSEVADAANQRTGGFLSGLLSSVSGS